MKIFFDLFPIILFFVVFKWGEGHSDTAHNFLQTWLGGFISGGTTPDQAPIMLATMIAIVATLLQIVYLLVRRKKIDGMLWISFFIIGIFGGMTIYFHNETFIKWKPTMLYWSYGIALIVSQLFMHKNLTRTFLIKLEEEMAIPEAIWAKLNLIWMAFFIGMGGLNLLIAYNFSTDAWVNFKLFGSMGCMFVFLIAQIIYLSRYSKPSEESS
jgi:intracellular septation protein